LKANSGYHSQFPEFVLDQEQGLTLTQGPKTEILNPSQGAPRPFIGQCAIWPRQPKRALGQTVESPGVRVSLHAKNQ